MTVKWPCTAEMARSDGNWIIIKFRYPMGSLVPQQSTQANCWHYCEHGYFHWGKNSRNGWQTLHAGVIFALPVRFTYRGCYFRFWVIFAINRQSGKMWKLPPCKNFHVFSIMSLWWSVPGIISFRAEEKCGEAVHAKLVELANNGVRCKLNQHKIKEAGDQYLRPKNVENLVTLKENNEIWGHLTRKVKNQDLRLQKTRALICNAIMSQLNLLDILLIAKEKARKLCQRTRRMIYGLCCLHNNDIVVT